MSNIAGYFILSSFTGARDDHYEGHVHSPHRVRYPRRRIGRKRDGQFKCISWEAAREEIGTRWRAIIADTGPHFYPTLQPLWHARYSQRIECRRSGLYNKLGAAISGRAFCDSGACTGYIMTLGPSAAVDPESLRHSLYIELWACNPMSTNVLLWSNRCVRWRTSDKIGAQLGRIVADYISEQQR